MPPALVPMRCACRPPTAVPPPCMQAIAKADPKSLHPHWLTLLPAQAPSPSRASYAATLADVMLYDPHEQVAVSGLNPVDSSI